MGTRRVVTAAEMEQMSHDERARLVTENMLDSVDELDPAFRARVEARGRRILEDRGLLDPEPT